MHADKLYHQMLDYEAKVAEAKDAGTEPPPAGSLFNPQYASKSPSEKENELQIPDGEQIPEEVQKGLKDLSPHERELEIRIIKQRKAQHSQYLDDLAPVLKAQTNSKEQRREQLSQWLGPTVASWITR